MTRDESPREDAADDLPFRLPVLPPMGNTWVVGLAAAELFDRGECRLLLDAARGKPDPERFDAAMERLGAMIQQANDQYFRFELSGAVGADEPLLVELADGSRTSEAGIGLTGALSTRKIAALLPIAVDGPGGRLTLSLAAKTEAIEVGHVLAWPAFLDALIELPDGGTVVALVVHGFGPVFR